MTINFKVPEIKELKPRILVLGVGGAGGNAINEMIDAGVEGVEFVAVNTDAQDLKTSKSKTIENTSGINNYYLHTVVKDNVAKLAVLVSLDTSDKSDTVKSFGKQLSMHIAASNPLALESNLIDQAVIDKEQELVAEELKNLGKPEEIVKKISSGKMNKFKEENALLTQAWVMEPKKKVEDVLKELSIAELKIKEFYRIKIGE